MKALGYLQMRQGKLIAGDGYRLHIAAINRLVPDGLYKWNGKELIHVKEELKYPDVDAVTPKEFRYEVNVNRTKLLYFAKNAKILADNNYCSMKLTFNNRLEIKAENPDLGKMEGEIDIDKIINPEVKIKINPRFVIDTLILFKSRAIKIKLPDDKPSCIIFEEIIGVFSLEVIEWP